MKEIVVAGGRAVGVGGGALLPAVLEEGQIHVALVGKDVEEEVAHRLDSFLGLRLAGLAG